MFRSCGVDFHFDRLSAERSLDHRAHPHRQMPLHLDPRFQQLLLRRDTAKNGSSRFYGNEHGPDALHIP